MISLLIGTILCATDLWCKEQIDHKHPAVARTLHRLPRKFAKDKFRIDCVHNKGLFCNLFETCPMVSKLLSVLMLAVVAVIGIPCCLFGLGSFLTRLGFGLVLGGGMSNTIDRFKKGYVVDYLNIRIWKPLRKIYCNLGDFGIFWGCLLLLISSLFSGRRK